MTLNKLTGFDLQLFGEATSGKKIIYLFRQHDKAAEEDGTMIAFATENGRSIKADADSTATKDGTIRTPSDPEVEVTASHLYMKGDYETRDKLEDAMANKTLMDIWEANLDEAGASANKFHGRYMQGFITGIEHSSPSDDFASMDLTFGINGTGVAGEVTVTTAQQELASYAFMDTPKTGA
jgi:TP901-1 family phage major tail protein